MTPARDVGDGEGGAARDGVAAAAGRVWPLTFALVVASGQRRSADVTLDG